MESTNTIRRWGDLCWPSQEGPFIEATKTALSQLINMFQEHNIKPLEDFRRSGQKMINNRKVVYRISITSSGLCRGASYYQRGLKMTFMPPKHTDPVKESDLSTVLRSYVIGLDDIEFIADQIKAMKMLREFLKRLQKETLLRKIWINESDIGMSGSVILTTEGIKHKRSAHDELISVPESVTLSLIRTLEINPEKVFLANEFLTA